MSEIRRINGELIDQDENLSLKELVVKNRANLYRADLQGANLYRADLYGANLYKANLQGADLQGADLYKANLYGADLEFYQFPSLRLLSSIQLGRVSTELTIELMRRDTAAHPYPERFDIWAKGGSCPYKNEERAWFFAEQRQLWVPGKPIMTDCDLIKAICKEKGWKIKGIDL